MNRYLVVRDDDGLVVNAVVWDGETEYSPEGCTLMPAEEHPGVWMGWRYLKKAETFVSPPPYDSWILDENHEWQAPTPPPSNDSSWLWDESTRSWVSPSD